MWVQQLAPWRVHPTPVQQQEPTQQQEVTQQEQQFWQQQQRPAQLHTNDSSRKAGASWAVRCVNWTFWQRGFEKGGGPTAEAAMFDAKHRGCGHAIAAAAAAEGLMGSAVSMLW
jgi:hypothetical protein